MNSGSMALSPKSVLAKVAEEKNLIEMNPTISLFSAWEKMWAVQKDLGQFFKADPKNIFLRTNVTYVMNDFIMSLKLPPGSEILISDIEYGAVVKICEYKAQTEGHTIKTFSLHDKGEAPEKTTAESMMQRLQAAITPKTKLVMLSHVMTGSGLKIPAEQMGKFLHSKNIFFACDGAHGAGSTELDFSKTEIDFYGTNLHKWLMGPKGTGFGYVHPRMREHLAPTWAGWTTGKMYPHHAAFGEGDAWTARWMICSTHNFSDFYGIPETLKFWRTHGSEKILSRQFELSELCQTTVSAKTGWKCLSRFPQETRGPLSAFALPAKTEARGFELMEFLQKEHQLTVSMTFIQGSWCLRLSPHIYNTEDEILRTAEILSKV